MDPALWELYESGSARDEVSVMLRLEEGAEAPESVRVVSRFGSVVTARVRRKDILATWNEDTVLSLKAPRPVVPQPPIEDGHGHEDGAEAEAFESASSLPLPNLPEDGTGVIVGVCDWGLDFTHANFRNPNGSTRLGALWDQRGEGDPRAPAPFGYGRLHTRAEIDAALASPDPCAALGYHPSSGDPSNTGAHGTHVTDIVAGSRREPGSQVGLASGSEIVFVHLAANTVRELDNLGDSVALLEGLDFIRRYAAGRPCVLHLSAGKTAGPHRGTTPLELAVDQMLLDTPGIALVQSVGNYAKAAMHTHARIGPNQDHRLDWLIPPRDRTPNELEIWYSGHDVLDVTLIAPSGQEFSVPLGDRVRVGDRGESWGNLYHRRREPNSGLNHIDVFLYPSAPSGTWRVVLHGREVVDGRLHAWIERDAGSRYQSRFPRRTATSRYTTNTICNSFRAIAVGAYDSSRAERPAAPFSSRGPTADGRQKPEVVAPGFRILAARSLPRDGWNGEPRLCVKSGTSMAAPWVSGTVALMFQAAGRPLSIAEVRRILVGTADPHPGPVGRTSSRLGYGYLNIEKAVEAARLIARQPPAAPPESRSAVAIEDVERGFAPVWLAEEAPLESESEIEGEADELEDEEYGATCGGWDLLPSTRETDSETEDEGALDHDDPDPEDDGLVTPGEAIGDSFDPTELAEFASEHHDE